MKTIIKLTSSEMFMGAFLGNMIRVHNHKLGYKEIHHTNSHEYGGAWQRETIGALGALAVAKRFNLYPNIIVASKQINMDVGGIYEVRTTGYKNGHLWAYPHDDDFKPYLLVIGDTDVFELKGWLTGGEAKTFPLEDKWNNGMPAHWIEQKDIHDMQELEKYDPMDRAAISGISDKPGEPRQQKSIFDE